MGCLSMNGSLRAVLAAGVVALTGGALVVCPPASAATAEVVTRPVISTAGVSAFVRPVEPPAAEDVKSALRLFGQLARDSSDVGDEPDELVAAAVGDPVVFNAASNVIDDVYSVARYWANYVALDLGPWLLGWVPLGYLIADQIYIWYPDLVLPTVDSFVYDFLDPVVNDPFNPAVWADGINAIAGTVATGLANGVADEINYILSLSWFPFPLPPLPPLPLSRVTSVATPDLTLAASGEAEEIVSDEPLADEAKRVSVEPGIEVVDEVENVTETDTETDVQDVPEELPVESGDEEPPTDVEADLESTEDDADSVDAPETEGAESDSADGGDETTETDTDKSDDTGDKGDTGSQE